MNVGMRIQELRVKNGLSQAALADKLGVTRQSVSKWELEQAMPETEKVIDMSRLFRVTTDDLLLINADSYLKPNQNVLHLGSIYLIVKNFQKSIDFYEKFLSMRVSTVNLNVFAEFYFNKQNISLMNESNLPGHDTTGSGDEKFVLNFCIDNLQMEHERVSSLRIGEVTEIKHIHTDYWCFHVYDPDKNVIEITGGYEGGEK